MVFWGLRGYIISRTSISNSTSVTQGNQKRYSTDEVEEMGVEYEKIDSGTKIDMHSKKIEMIKQYEKESGKLMETIAIQIIVIFLINMRVSTGKIV
ncbi:hypothetical protein [Psychrobacter sp. Ps6]|uniref:hypothetical protein n=1 Tax=Psychrobacter sp. Ps6 TaxID=2790960 RepID=UPI001EDF49DA|nr:hypothetical protein [Psychrobacter sp. Ps6]MCG3879443.1 hypothetical protein [Psychrobacter sp. Ps6]